MVIAKVDGVTSSIPPPNWVVEWLAGHNVVELKKSSKKATGSTDTAAPIPAVAPSNWPNHPIHPWPYPLQFPYQQPPSIYPLPTQQLLPVQQPLLPQHEGSDDDTLLHDYGNWLADREKNLQRRQAIKEAINKASSEFVKLEHLRTIDQLEGVPYGIMIDLKGNLKAFKEFKKAQNLEKTRELDVQIGLFALAQAGQQYP
ncbi:hypothetical protein ACMFMG_008363 [Clarireedia jacksonii]